VRSLTEALREELQPSEFQLPVLAWLLEEASQPELQGFRLRALAQAGRPRAPMLIHLYVTAVPGRACRRQASRLSANSDLFGCAARHQFLVIGGLSN